jgi:hypothetical protein
VEVVDDSSAAFPAGTTKIVNFTAEPFRIELEGENFDCDANGQLLIKEQPVRSNHSSGMKAYRKDEDGEWFQVNAAVWPHPGTKRVIQIISFNAVTNQVELRGVRDISKPRQ